MGHTRFRRSIKIMPGVKVNFNKNSVGVTFGGKGAHYTINSSGRKTASVGIPGTGLYYTESTGGGGNFGKSSGGVSYNSSVSVNPPKSNFEIATKKMKNNTILFIFTGLIGFTALSAGDYLWFAILEIVTALLILLRRPKLKAAKVEEEAKALELQKFLTGQNDTVLRFSPQELTLKAYNMARDYLMNYRESITTMSKANDPMTFFDAYEDSLSALDELLKYESYIKFDDATPSDIAKAMQDNKDEIFMEFVQGYFKETKKRANDLTTVKGRNGRYQRFYENLKPYFEYMNDECVRFIEDSYRDSIEEA